MEKSAESSPKTSRRSRLGVALGLLVVIYIASALYVDSLGWMDNNACFRLMGCNVGFFGYDAVRHVSSGIIEVLFITWLIRKYPRLSFKNGVLWKNIFIWAAIIVFLGYVWELGEFSRDHWRMDIMHWNIVNPNMMDQASNSDTMGDLTFNLLGAMATVGFIGIKSKIWKPRLPV